MIKAWLYGKDILLNTKGEPYAKRFDEGGKAGLRQHH